MSTVSSSLGWGGFREVFELFLGFKKSRVVLEKEFFAFFCSFLAKIEIFFVCLVKVCLKTSKKLSFCEKIFEIKPKFVLDTFFLARLKRYF